MAKRPGGKQPGELIDACVLASAVVSAGFAGLGLPDRQGIADPALRHGTTVAVALVGFVAGSWLGRRLLVDIRAGSWDRGARRGLSLGVVALVAIATLLASIAAIRVTEVMELRSEPPRVMGIVGAYVVGLLTMQWALVATIRDLGPSALRIRVPVLRRRRIRVAASIVSAPARPHPPSPLSALDLAQPVAPAPVTWSGAPR